MTRPPTCGRPPRVSRRKSRPEPHLPPNEQQTPKTPPVPEPKSRALSKGLSHPMSSTACQSHSPPRVQITGRVLVVDDHAPARESIILALRHAGHYACGCASGAEALERLQEEPFDVVITDLQMPGMDGLELIRTIQRRRIGTQVVMITAHASVATAVEAMRHGALDYIEKPFDVAQLEALVRRAVERARALERRGLEAVRFRLMD